MTFVKGQSGNPSGRPKSDAQIIALAKEKTTEALNALVRVATKGRSESAVVAAAVALLDRGWGRPAQTIKGDAEAPLQVNVTGQRDAFAARIAALAERAKADDEKRVH